MAAVERLIDFYCRFLKVAIAACLAAMVVLVFTNVVMRYLFNSGFRPRRSCRAGFWCG